MVHLILRKLFQPLSVPLTLLPDLQTVVYDLTPLFGTTVPQIYSFLMIILIPDTDSFRCECL